MNLFGIKRKTFEEIKAEIDMSLARSLGSINLAPPSVLGSIVAIFTDREVQIWEQIEALYNSIYPNTAEGYSLDGICALNGVSRSQATYSRATCQLTGVLYTKIPKNSLIKVQNTSNLFALEEDVVITNEKCQSIKLRIKNNNSPSYGLIINGQALKLDKKQNDSTEEIAFGLGQIVKEAKLGLNALCDDDTISIASLNALPEFSCLTTDEIEVVECTNNAHVIATEKGSIAAPIGSLNTIHTPISGWISCDNLAAAKIGNNLESDKALRARREQSIKIGGSGSLEAIRANLLNLSEVTAVSIDENNTSTDKAGLPPHSFEALITGGNDLEIAKTIWQKKPAGIRSYGKCSIITFDSQSREQVVYFSRPVVRFIYAKIVITKTKNFIDAAESSIKANIISQINSLGVGNPVILKSLFVSIFSESGIANASIELGSSLQESNLPTLKEADVSLKNNEVALTDHLKIQIILEDF